MSPDKILLERKLTGIPKLLWLMEVGIGRGKLCHPAHLDYLAACASTNTDLRLKETYSYLETMQAESVSISDDAVRCIFQSTTLTVAVCDSESLRCRLNDYRMGCDIAGEHRPWANGYWVPEALCADLAFCRICHDPLGEASDLARSLSVYPYPLSESITSLCRQEINAKIPALLRTGRPVEQALVKADVVASLIRFAFAADHQYLRGFQHLDLQAEQLSSRAASIYQMSTSLASSGVPIQQGLYQTIYNEVVNAKTYGE